MPGVVVEAPHFLPCRSKGSAGSAPGAFVCARRHFSRKPHPVVPDHLQLDSLGCPAVRCFSEPWVFIRLTPIACGPKNFTACPWFRATIRIWSSPFHYVQLLSPPAASALRSRTELFCATLRRDPREIRVWLVAHILAHRF